MELSHQNVVVALEELSVEKTEELVFHLGVEQYRLDDIAMKCKDRSLLKIHFIEEWWEGDLDASWKKLISGLKRIKMNDLATSLESTFSMC